MSKWYKASEIERLKNKTPRDGPRDGVNGLPDNHVIMVSERTIEIDMPELVQNNVSTDTYTLELDAEWNDITPIVIFSNSKGDYQVAYENAPTKIPAAAMAVIGSVDVSVFGLDSTGKVRVVTKAAPDAMTVIESGKFVGEISENDASLLGQILAAVDKANQAAQDFETEAAKVPTSAQAATLESGQSATAVIENKILKLGIPQGPQGIQGLQGPKGDRGESGSSNVDKITNTEIEDICK